MDYSFLILLSVVAVSCYSDLKNNKLDISLKSDNVGVEYYERDFDNVSYSYFKPKNGTVVRSVYFQNDQVWTPLDSNEYLRYALVANKNDKPSLLYLLLAGADRTSDEYYYNDGDQWKKSTKFDFNLYLTRMKDLVTVRNVSMFLTTAGSSPYFNVYNFSGKTEYMFAYLKTGLSCFHVFYRGRIWISPNKQDRCVAAWAYKVNSDDYNLVRLLITHANNTSELLTFKYNGNRDKKWVPYTDELKEEGMPDLRYAENLIHPEYEFVNKKSEVYFPKPETATKYETFVHNEDPQSLYFDPSVLNHHVRTNHEFLDDVYYYHYSPKSDTMVTKIFSSYQKVWESCLGETLKYALVVHDDSGPVMAYLLLKFDLKVKSLFLRKKNDTWSRTDSEYYKTKVRVLASETKIFNYHKLDLFKNFNNQFYDVSFSPDYVFYTPRCGHRVSTLLYRNQKVWTPANRERCVAFCAYTGGNYYMLKLLVTNDNKSEVLLYYRLDETFVKVDSVDVRKNLDDKKEYFFSSNGKSYSVDENHGKLALEPPYEFYYPQYEFTFKFDELDYTQPLDKYEPLFDMSKVYTDPLEKTYMNDFLTPLYPSKDCVKLDVANYDKTSTTYTESVFDEVLDVGYFEPAPGKYFSEISENGVKLYSKKLPSEACIGVTFYKNRNGFLLADVLVANKRPASIHLQKFKGIWRYVNKEEFETLLQDLKKSHKS